MKKNVYEILDEFKAAKSEDDKRRVLVRNATPDFVGFLQCAFDPRVKFVKFPLPTPVNAKYGGEGEYRPDYAPAGMGYTNMGNAIKKAYLFIDGHPKRPPALTPEKTADLLIQILEGLEAREAEIYLLMIEKKVKVPALTKALIEKTFPNIFQIPVNV
jgi:hypothetical protein